MDAIPIRAEEPDRTVFNDIARRIGRRLRDVYPNPENEPLPADHVQMLLELRHKERTRDSRRG